MSLFAGQHHISADYSPSFHNTLCLDKTAFFVVVLCSFFFFFGLTKNHCLVIEEVLIFHVENHHQLFK